MEVGEMVLKLVEMVMGKIEEENLLVISIECGTCHIMNAFIPDTINTENGIYIEGEYFILDISNKNEYQIEYNEMEDEFIIRQGNTIFYLS